MLRRMRALWLIVALAPSALACGSQSPSAAGVGGGAYSPCAGKACGETCTICSPAATDCMETMVVKQCNAQGACSTDPVDCPK